MVTAVDWEVAAGDLESRSPFYEDLVAAKTPTVRESREPSPSSDLLGRLREVPEQQRPGLLVSFIQNELKAVLRMPSPPSPAVSFFDLGVDSLMAVELRNRINRGLAGEYTASNTVVFDFPTADGLAGFLSRELGGLGGPAPAPAPMQAASRPPALKRPLDEPIAIVGMACRFPGAPDIDAFWRQLDEGGSAIAEGRSDDGDWTGLLGDPKADEPLYRRGAFVDGIDRFDSGFFRIPPIEARLMDPQHRILLETTWQALEDACIDPEGLRGSRTGVFAGVGSSGYRELVASRGQGYSYSGTGEAMAVGRVAFALGLEGPAMPLDLACASSLAAVQQAVVSLQRGEVDLALAGGVNVTLSPVVSQFLIEMGMLSASGQCNAFDAAADGYVRGEGCGMVVLKRLSEAESDGDRIWGVVLGTAVNQNGMSAKLMAPNGPAQERAMRDALTRAGVSPSDVDYLEAQGVGSEFGDPIEMNAVASVYGVGRDANRPLLLGSVKTNIGHLEWASGIASLIKTVLALRRGVIPRHLHFKNPSPLLDWDRLPVRVASEASSWPSGRGGSPLAAVNAYGLSGANAHVVLGGYQGADSGGFPSWPTGSSQPVPVAGLATDSSLNAVDMKERSTRFLPLSGKSAAALRELAQRYLEYLDETPGELLPAEVAVHPSLADMVWTAGTGRSHFAHRAGVVFGNAAQLRKGLQELVASGEEVDGGQLVPHLPEPPKVAFVYSGQAGPGLRMGQYLYETEPVFREILEYCNEKVVEELGVAFLDEIIGESGGAAVDSNSALGRSTVYAVECAMTALWKSVGSSPVAVAGYGHGKIAAAHAAGTISLEEGLRLALSADVPASESARPELSETSVTLVDGANGQAFQPGSVPDYSYWSALGHETSAGCAWTLARMGARVVVEMGPTSAFGEEIRDCWPEEALGEERQPPVLQSMGQSLEGVERDSGAAFVEGVAKLYEAGLSPEFTGLFAGELRRRVPLPGYPFQGRRHWVDAPVDGSQA